MPLLIKVDNDGCIIPDCGKTNNIDTKAEEGNKLFTIYPNPFSDRLIIQNYSSNKLLYRVHDMQGKLMTEWYCDDPEETNIVLTHHWPIGVYVVNAVDSDGLAHSESIIKQ
ncbi:MAG: T9SS type A sorting domain-containing protein [Saprospiraceae bacterium]|nr:T9SS type A sorting domain-containing protein [Saprospiraceae bacterium]